jgi:CheY-like chemotaxis protein
MAVPNDEGYRVLLAEDEAAVAMAYSKLLQAFGHSVVLVYNGKDALSKLEEQEFDIVLMDIHMPVMNGIEAICEIRNSVPKPYSHIPIIAVTAYCMTGDREYFLEIGADAYVPKPCSIKELDAEIRSLVPANIFS